MRRTIAAIVVVAACAFLIGTAPAARAQGFSYKTPAEVAQALKSAGGTIHELAKTPGGRDLLLLELGKKGRNVPAIFVVANMEGNCPIASEAALQLVAKLTGDWKDELDKHRWYIIALGNPDGYARFFDRPLAASFVNGRAINDDMDDATNEDGPDDLNKDGFITQMRQVHPEGRWIAVADNPLLLRKADEAKGEKGMYRLYDEGIDNDGDGEINEDGPGGANPGWNFPHAFEHYRSQNGPWAASEVESRAILEFTFAHPEIAMAITFGRANSLKEVPENTRQAASAGGSYEVPERFASWLGLEPDTKYPIKEILEAAQDATGNQNLSEDQVLQWLGAGAAVNPDKKDVSYWKEISKRYNDFIKDEAEMEDERLDPPGFSDGCFEEWAYFQFGIPSFAMDFWTLPKPKKEEKKEDGKLTPDDIEKMSNEEFIELGAAKIDSILKDVGAPPQFNAERVLKGLEGGMMNTKRIAKFMKSQKKDDEGGKADEKDEALLAYDSTAFVPWTSYNHPTLGKVEIGGAAPWRNLTPSPDLVEGLVAKQIPFVKQLAGLLPEVGIADVKLERVAANVWKVEAWVVNNGFLPFPTNQGKRCERPTPAMVKLTGSSIEFLEGREQRTLDLLDGSGGVEKVKWLINAPDGSGITIEAMSFSAGGETRAVTLTEGGGR